MKFPCPSPLLFFVRSTKLNVTKNALSGFEIDINI